MRTISLIEKVDGKITKEIELSGENLSEIYFATLSSANKKHQGECLPETIKKLKDLNLLELIPDEY